MRKIKAIVIHCSAGPDGVPKSLAQLIKEHQAKGWRTIGYHYIIQPDGKREIGRPLEEAGAHVQGHNADTVGICMLGKERFTRAQWDELAKLIRELRSTYRDVPVRGHRDYSPDLNKDGKIQSREWIKTCPGFDVETFMLRGLEPLQEDVL